MSSVTSFLARSSLSFDSAWFVLATANSTLSVVSATTSIEPHMLSISSDLCPAGITKDFCIFSWSRTGKSRSSSSRLFADTLTGSSAALNTFNRLFRELPLAVFPAGSTGKSRAIAAYIIEIAKNVFFRTPTSLVQSAQRPICALLHRRIQIRCLHKSPQPLRRIGIAPFQHQINQSHLYQWRLLFQQRIHNSLVNLRLGAVPA